MEVARGPSFGKAQSVLHKYSVISRNDHNDNASNEDRHGGNRENFNQSISSYLEPRNRAGGFAYYSNGAHSSSSVYQIYQQAPLNTGGAPSNFKIPMKNYYLNAHSDDAKSLNSSN